MHQFCDAHTCTGESKPFQRGGRVPETLPAEVLGKMSAPPKSDVPIIKPNEASRSRRVCFRVPYMIWHDGCTIQVLSGYNWWPLVFTVTCRQASWNLHLHRVSEWRTRDYCANYRPYGECHHAVGSPWDDICIDYRLTAITQLVHHGMIFVPISYTFGAGMYEMEEAHMEQALMPETAPPRPAAGNSCKEAQNCCLIN